MTDSNIESANANHVDFGLGPAPPQMGLQWATVGWDDKVEVVDIGSSTNDGVTLVFVTTYAGRTPGDPPKPGVAQGHKYIAQILGPFWRIPKKGERVIVGFPSGMETTTGAAVILGTVGASPGNQFAANRAKLDFGADVDLVIKARSITCSDYGNRFMVIGPDTGALVQDESGSGFSCKAGTFAAWSASGGAMKSCLQLSPTDANLVVNGGSMLQLNASKATLFGIATYVRGGAVYLGSACLATGQFCHYGPPGAPLASATVFVSA